MSTPTTNDWYRQYEEAKPLALPYTNTNTKITIDAFHAVCDTCNVRTPDVRGTIESEIEATLIRSVGYCAVCNRVLTNTTRIYPGGRLVCLSDGELIEVLNQTPPTPWRRLCQWAHNLTTSNEKKS